MIKKLKKGFTLVELVVVIAVIAILSAVSVVTYVSITNKAHQSANEQLVTQFNNIIKGDPDIKAPHDALKMLEAKGTKLANLDPEQKEKYQFAYHSTAKRVIIMDADSTKILFPADLKKDSLSSADKVAIFKFAKETSSLGYLNNNGFSYYLADEGFEGTLTIKTGVDVGENDDVSLTYNNSTGSRQDVILRTNSSEAIVNVTAYKNSDETICDKVEHFGEAKEVIGNVCGLSSLHEFGKVVDLDIFQGRVVLEEGHDVNTIISRNEDVIIETKSSQPEHAYGAGHDTNSGNVPLDEIADTPEAIDEKKEEAEEELNPSVNEVIHVQSAADFLGEFSEQSVTIRSETNAVTLKTFIKSNVTFILDANVKLTNAIAVASGRNVTIDLNGHDLEFEDASINTVMTAGNTACAVFVEENSQLTLEDSVGTGRLWANGEIMNEDDPGNFYAIVFVDGTLIVNGGKIYNWCGMFELPATAGNGTVVVNGGTTNANHIYATTVIDNR